MSTIDWAILAVYILGMVGMSMYLSRGQESADDYYVGGRNLPWWAVGISTMATQTSANSFIGIPAFVALKEGGGLTWLQYELAVPIAMIFVMVFLIPLFRSLELISVYEYLELRFDPFTRKAMSAVFLISRGLATGIGVYASAVVLEVCLGIPVWACILIIGITTIIYDTLGGMAAVVYSDVVQMVVLLVGLVLCIVMAVGETGGIAETIAAHSTDRLSGVDPRHGIGDGSKAPFWGFLVGGFVLYTSYYGVDQSQAQRELSAPTTEDTKRSLVFNGIARFPLTILYLLMGLAIGAAYHASEDLQAAVPDDRLDQLVPQFILMHLPVGVRGILFAALLAAAMSSLDSALNSLSASTMADFIEPHIAGASKEDHDRYMLRASKVTTVAWGTVMTVFAFFVGGISDTVVEGINKVGALFYGPILAAFLTGILDRRARGRAMLAGVVLGVGINIVLWQLNPELYWMWWNVTGLFVAVFTTSALSRLMDPPHPSKLERTTLAFEGIVERERKWLRPYVILGAYFVGILVVAWFSDDLLTAFV